MAGQVFAVASGKGGVGKTTTVVNLGVALRRADHSVVLVDGDLGMANLGTLLGISSDATLHDVLAGEASIESALVEEAAGFGVLVGSEALTSYPDADPKELRALLEPLAERYEYVLVDTGAGMSHEDVLPLGLADQVILVTTPDPAAIGDAGKTAELADLAEGDVAGCVVTQADASTDGHYVAAQLGVDLLGVVPFDHAVRESTALGSPLEAHDPTGPAAAAYRALAAALAGEEPLAPLAPNEAIAADEGANRAAVEAAPDAPAEAGEADEDGVAPEASDGEAVEADGSAEATDEPAATDVDDGTAGDVADGSAEVEANEVDAEAADEVDAEDSAEEDAGASDEAGEDESAEGDDEPPVAEAVDDEPAADDVGNAVAEPATEADEGPSAGSTEGDGDAPEVETEAATDGETSEADDDGATDAEDDEDDLEAYLEELDDPEPGPSGGLLARLGRLFR